MQPEIRLLLIKQVILEKSEDKMFAIRMTSLSHTPGDESGARALQRSYERETDELIKLMYYSSNYYATMLDAKEELEKMQSSGDGVMRFTE